MFHHDTHTHPFVPPVSGATSGPFVVPNTVETATNVFYRIHLKVSDSSGFTPGGRTYSFRRWSDGGWATRVITTPSANTTYTATIRRR